MTRPIKIEFVISGEMIKPFKEKFPELSNLSDKVVMTALIKDEFFRANSEELFNPRFYTTQDIKEIFQL